MQARADLRELRDEVEEPTVICHRAAASRGVKPGAGRKGVRSHKPRKLQRRVSGSCRTGPATAPRQASVQ